MALKIYGDRGYEADVSADKALMIESRPPARYGVFACSGQTGVVGSNVASTANLICICWQNPFALCLVRRLSLSIVMSQSATTPGTIDIAVFFARSFTVAPSIAGSGSSRSFFGHDNHKLRTSFGSSLTAFVACSNDGGDMGGTYTADTNPLARYVTWSTGAAPAMVQQRFNLIDRTGYGQHPIVLAKNEGLVLTCPSNTVTGGNPAWSYTATLEWQEAYSY